MINGKKTFMCFTKRKLIKSTGHKKITTLKKLNSPDTKCQLKSYKMHFLMFKVCIKLTQLHWERNINYTNTMLKLNFKRKRLTISCNLYKIKSFILGKNKVVGKNFTKTFIVFQHYLPL